MIATINNWVSKVVDTVSGPFQAPEPSKTVKKVVKSKPVKSKKSRRK